jgi:histidinol-phosphate aminotransferase
VEIDAELERWRPRVVYLCNPNNPTGVVVAPDLILAWVRRHPDTMFVVDEAYHNFAPGLASLLSAREQHLLVLRSMTKDYALAGLRVGYAVGAEEVIAALGNVSQPWSVNSMAQAAASSALGDERHLKQTLEDLTRAKGTLVKGLIGLGFDVYPSATHFFLVRVGDGLAFRQALLKHAILVRDAASFGLPTFIRLGTRRAEDNDRLLTVLREECPSACAVQNKDGQHCLSTSSVTP